MTDIIPTIATVQYSAKVPTEVRFANREAGLFLQVDVTGLSVTDADLAIVEAYQRIKGLVEAQVALPEAAAVAIVQSEFPGAQVEHPRTHATSTASTAPAAKPYTAKAENACAQCGSINFEDFRAAKKAGSVKPRFPDFKCIGEFEGKRCGKGVWVEEKAAS